MLVLFTFQVWLQVWYIYIYIYFSWTKITLWSQDFIEEGESELITANITYCIRILPHVVDKVRKHSHSRTLRFSKFNLTQNCLVILVEYEMNLVLAQCLIDRWVGGIFWSVWGRITLHMQYCCIRFRRPLSELNIFFEVPNTLVYEVPCRMLDQSITVLDKYIISDCHLHVAITSDYTF